MLSANSRGLWDSIELKERRNFVMVIEGPRNGISSPCGDLKIKASMNINLKAAST
jgi:hypothetical protein